MSKKIKDKTVGIIIAGGRNFNDYMLLKAKCDYYLSKLIQAGYTIEIISGHARGADQLGERYAKEKGYKIITYIPNWEIGKRAGYIRNENMAKHETSYALIAFWDKKSRGTKHMIGLAKEYGLHVKVVNY